MATKTKVLIVCMGNTCRSPLAEAIFRRYLEKNSLNDEWEVDSAALLGCHEGKSINSKTSEVLEKNGIFDYEHIAKTIKKEDFQYYDWILGMDYCNLWLLDRMMPQLGSSPNIALLGQYDPKGDKIIEDPYFDSDIKRFEKAFQQCSRSIPEFVKHIQQNSILRV